MTDILQQKIAYYRARAGEYDEWFYRVGRYDRGADWNARWFAEVEMLRLEKVRKATKLGGRVFMIDSLPDYTHTSSAVNHAPYQPDNIYHTRKLNDGQEFTIVKVFYEPDALTRKLSEHGFRAPVHTTGHYFWWASGVRKDRT